MKNETVIVLKSTKGDVKLKVKDGIVHIPDGYYYVLPGLDVKTVTNWEKK